MATVLLDTHTMMWAAGDPSRLGHQARQVLEDPTTEPIISAASWWEIAIKFHAGKLPQGEILLARRHMLESGLGATSLPITVDHAVLAGQLSWHHRDPFDRMLAAQALHEGIPLVTLDAHFGDVSGLRVLW